MCIRDRIDAGAELGAEGLLGPAGRRDLDGVFARILVQPVEFEVAVIVGGGLRHHGAALEQAHAGALDAIDDAICLHRDRAADEAFCVAPQILVVDAWTRAELGFHDFEPLLARELRHLVIFYAERAHGAGWARLLAARLLPALVNEMRVEGPGLRQLQFLVPPDVAIGAGVDQILAPLRLDRIDEHDAVVAFFHRATAFGDAGRVVAVVAHRRHIGDVDRRQLAALFLQDIDPLVAVLWHRRRIAGKLVTDVFVHACQRAQVAIGALGDVDNHVPFIHRIHTTSRADRSSLRYLRHDEMKELERRAARRLDGRGLGRSEVDAGTLFDVVILIVCLLYTSPSPRDRTRSR